jgi:hypothetical protein
VKFQQTTTAAPVRPPAVALPPAPEPQRPLLSEMTNGELLGAAGIVSGVVALALTILAVMVCYLLSAPAAAYVVVAGCGLVVGLVMFAALTINWITRAVERRNPRLEYVEEVIEEGGAAYQPPNAGELLDLAGRKIIELHFIAGREAGREECEKILKVTQGQWNDVNAALIAAGIKGKRGWSADVKTYEQAMQAYNRIAFVGDGTAWIRNATGQEGKRVSLR